ncbi:MAG TPA: hypothetical protein VK578_19585 [Edaphobacter sp.]|nr:hypothetical protein [Edaphobacter sp.]
MRLDIPQDVPRRREIAPDGHSSSDNRTTPSVAPETPVQRRLDSLRERADNRQPHHPRPRRERGAAPRAVPREPRVRTDPEDTRRARRVPHEVIGLELRTEEKKLLTEVGRFRVVRVEDLNQTIYDGKSRKLENDLNYLRDKGLVETLRVNLRHDGKRRTIERVEVATLTKAGRNLLIKQDDLPKDQKVYAGLVKPREVEHDSQIYRAYRKEAERIEKNGGTNLRVRLDFEIKADIQKAIYAERKADPKRDMGEIKQQVATRLELPFVDGKIQIPDARIDYDLPREANQDIDQGSRTGHEDMEVLTAAYHAGHLRSKAQAGFRNYASASDRATLTAKIEDDSHLMENILEL